jgi:amino acid permease
MKNKFLPALAILVGTAVGAGYLGIPYVVAKSGFLPGIALLVFVALFMLAIQLYLGEVSLRTRGNHQLTGYAEKYLGKTGKMLMFFSMIFGIYSALAAYLLAEGKSISYVIMGDENYTFVFSIIFWVLMSGLTYVGLKALKKYEKIGMMLVLATIALIAALFFKGINFENLTYFNSQNIFLPFGVILFSFLAFSAMPEVERVLLGQEKLMKKVVLWGIAIPFFVYLIFMLIMVGNFGVNVPEIAVLALGRFFSILGVLTMFTAFFTLTLAIRDMFRFDFNMGRFKGWLLAVLIPLVLFLIIFFAELASFVQILSISGIVSGGLAGILILLMNRKAKKMGNRKPEYAIPINWWIIIVMSAIFIAAVLAEFLL